jgi:hypothetical protein
MPPESPFDHEQQYRVFISYSHQDYELVTKIVEILESNDIKAMWDRDFRFGHGFHEQIKNFIAHSHVFLPVITPTANKRNWVHQEIGYAMSLNIPILPLAAGQLPGEMIREIHAVQVGDNMTELKEILSRNVIANIVQRYSDTAYALFRCADYAEDRATMMAKYCNDVKELGYSALFRQKGALSSLHIPDKIITNPVWKERYGGLDRGPTHSKLQREERLAIEVHARSAGCKLIINPYISYDKYDNCHSVRLVRLNCLLEFLESMPDFQCQVAINPTMDHDQSLTILGDWFAAESVSARIGQGYRQTIFTRHAPSMLSKIESFDQEFNELLDASKWIAETSRTEAISIIRKIITQLKKKTSVRSKKK